MIVESREMAEAIQEFTLGLRQQVMYIYACNLQCYTYIIG